MIWAALLVLAAPDLAREASLPPHFVDEGQAPGDDDYQPIPDLRGTYAHGWLGVGFDRQWDEEPCQGSPAEQEAALKRVAGDGDTEFWLYNTPAQGILFRRTARFDRTKPCASMPVYDYDLQRAWAANGWNHSVGVTGSNAMEAIGSWPVDSAAGQYASGFRTLQSLMARPGPNPRAPRQSSETIAGVRAECRGMSGLVWSTVCTARSGPVKGMILRAQSGDDERTMFSLVVLELRTSAMLPGKLFELGRTWRGRD